MKQPWIISPYQDLWITAPPFIVVAIAFIFNQQLTQIEAHYSWWTWLILVVLVDVAHVYASLFRTYLHPASFQKRRILYVGLPLFCLLFSLVLYQLGAAVFWSVLAYIAVFHFIRQQWGLMRLYARFEPKTKLSTSLDALIIYTATLYPMLYWMISQNRNFNWFVEHEFILIPWAGSLPILTTCYWIIIGLYVFRICQQWLQERQFNLPKNLIIIGTFLSWYVGIVHFNHPLIFTLLNVISHGIPYMALVYFSDIAHKSKTFSVIGNLRSWSGLGIYLGLLAGLAIIEETIWELSVWGEHV